MEKTGEKLKKNCKKRLSEKNIQKPKIKCQKNPFFRKDVSVQKHP